MTNENVLVKIPSATEAMPLMMRFAKPVKLGMSPETLASNTSTVDWYNTPVSSGAGRTDYNRDFNTDH